MTYVGGASLVGGRGTVISSFSGVLIIATLDSGMTQIGTEKPTKRLVTGAVIIAAVIANAYRHRMAGPASRRYFERMIELVFGKRAAKSAKKLEKANRGAKTSICRQ